MRIFKFLFPIFVVANCYTVPTHGLYYMLKERWEGREKAKEKAKKKRQKSNMAIAGALVVGGLILWAYLAKREEIDQLFQENGWPLPSALFESVDKQVGSQAVVSPNTGDIMLHNIIKYNTVRTYSDDQVIQALPSPPSSRKSSHASVPSTGSQQANQAAQVVALSTPLALFDQWLKLEEGRAEHFVRLQEDKKAIEDHKSSIVALESQLKDKRQEVARLSKTVKTKEEKDYLDSVKKDLKSLENRLEDKKDDLPRLKDIVGKMRDIYDQNSQVAVQVKSKLLDSFESYSFDFSLDSVRENYSLFDGGTPLHFAAYAGNIAVCKRLINSGVDVNKRSSKRFTSFDCAAKNGHVDTCKYLVSKGAKISVSSFLFASHNGHLELCKYLVSQGADVNQATKEGATALLFASRNGHLELCKYLVSQGADVNQANEDGYAPLHVASQSGQEAVYKYLVSQGGKELKIGDFTYIGDEADLRDALSYFV